MLGCRNLQYRNTFNFCEESLIGFSAEWYVPNPEVFCQSDRRMEVGERSINVKVTGQVRIRAVAVSKGGTKDYKRDVRDKQFIGKPSECPSNIYLTWENWVNHFGAKFPWWKVKRLD